MKAAGHFIGNSRLLGVTAHPASALIGFGLVLVLGTLALPGHGHGQVSDTAVEAQTEVTSDSDTQGEAETGDNLQVFDPTQCFQVQDAAGDTKLLCHEDLLRTIPGTIESPFASPHGNGTQTQIGSQPDICKDFPCLRQCPKTQECPNEEPVT